MAHKHTGLFLSFFVTPPPDQQLKKKSVRFKYKSSCPDFCLKTGTGITGPTSLQGRRWLEQSFGRSCIKMPLAPMVSPGQVSAALSDVLGIILNICVSLK